MNIAIENISPYLTDLSNFISSMILKLIYRRKLYKYLSFFVNANIERKALNRKIYYFSIRSRINVKFINKWSRQESYIDPFLLFSIDWVNPHQLMCYHDDFIWKVSNSNFKTFFPFNYFQRNAAEQGKFQFKHHALFLRILISKLTYFTNIWIFRWINDS